MHAPSPTSPVDTPNHGPQSHDKPLTSSQVKFCSLNIRRLNTPEKRSQLLHTLKQNKIHIAFIQETHFRSDNIPKLSNHHYPTVYHASNDESKTNGVSILIAKNCPLLISEVKKDDKGRYLFLKGTLHNKSITLANLYAPNTIQVPFFRETLQHLTDYYSGILIVGGDFNVTLSPTQDSSTGASSMPYRALRTIKKLLQNLTLHYTRTKGTSRSTPHPIISIRESTISLSPKWTYHFYRKPLLTLWFSQITIHIP